MLAFFIGGLLLSAVQSSKSQSSILQTAEHSVQPNTNFLRMAIQQQQPNPEEILPFEGFNSRFWFGQGYRQAFLQLMQANNEPSGVKGLNYYRAVDGSNNRVSLMGDDMGGQLPSRERIGLSALTTKESTNMDKRDSYLSMCHFKLCNLGRKRRISQHSGLTELFPNVASAEK